MMQSSEQGLRTINRLFIGALIALADTGKPDDACRLAARGWSVLRHNNGREAERLGAALHRLARSVSVVSHDGKGADHD